jgi:hypothetical protein
LHQAGLRSLLSWPRSPLEIPPVASLSKFILYNLQANSAIPIHRGCTDNGRTRLKGFEPGLDIKREDPKIVFGDKCRQECGFPVGFQLFLAGGFFYDILPAILQMGVTDKMW